MLIRENDLWVFVEWKEPDNVSCVSLELLSLGTDLAKQMNGRLVAVIFGEKTDQVIPQLEEYGADCILTVEGEIYREYSSDIYAETLSKLLEKYRPEGVLIGATHLGRDMSPRVASRLKTGLTADCTEVKYEEASRRLLFTRPTLGGNLMACIQCPESRPQMGTVRSGIYLKKKQRKEEIEIRREGVTLENVVPRVRVYKTIREKDEEQDFEHAEIIVAGGKGLQNAEGFKVLRELAEALGGTVGATRGAVECGWISRTRQVGQTGRIVRPKLYIACGISGAVQHVVGMSGAEKIIAINQDRGAPIFKIADYGIAGDLYEIVPALTKKVLTEKRRKTKREGSKIL